MAETPPTHSFLPDTRSGRIGLGLLSVPPLLLSSTFLYALAIGPAGANLGDQVFRAAMGEFLLALFLLSLSGFVWALFAPDWLPRLAWSAMRRFSLWLLVGFVCMLAFSFLG